MGIYRITYNEGDTINLAVTLNAEDARGAATVFMIEKPNSDIVKVEELREDD